MENREKKEFGTELHNQIIGWTNNCDTKASIMIAFLGIFVSIFFTSDYILKTLQQLLSPIFHYWQNGEGSFCLLSFIIFTLFVLTFLFLIWAILLLFNVLIGKIKSEENSIIFFQKIQENKTLENYIEKINISNDEDIIKDRYTQIYNCSIRCSEKFNKYNKAVNKIKLGLLFLLLFIICIIIYNS